MEEAENLNIYSIRFRTSTTRGTLDIAVQKKIVEADSELGAMEILKLKQKEAGIAETRIESIERMNVPKTIEKPKKKKTPIVLIFFILLGVATLARLAGKLF